MSQNLTELFIIYPDYLTNQLQEQIILMEDLEEKLDTLQMMQLAETGFSEWNDEEEDIYDV